MTCNPKHLIIDGHALVYRNFFGYINESIEDIILMSKINMLYKIQELTKRYKTTDTIVVFDCENHSWRKVYTSDANEEKVTHKKYKEGRREGLTTAEYKKLEELEASIKTLISFFRTQTSIVCLQRNYLEGDDLIAGFVHMHKFDDHVIYSADKDFLQLINSIPGSVTLVESQKDTERSLDDWDGDPELFLFEKCFRGEPRGGDNIQNAYPRLLRKKIIAAYYDKFAFNNIMNHCFEVSDIGRDGSPVYYKYRTKDIFDENKLLMGLNNQPKYIKNIIRDTISEEIQNVGKFDYMEFLRFCKSSGMDRIILEKDKFVHILSKSYTTSSSVSAPAGSEPHGPLLAPGP